MIPFDSHWHYNSWGWRQGSRIHHSLYICSISDFLSPCHSHVRSYISIQYMELSQWQLYLVFEFNKISWMVLRSTMLQLKAKHIWRWFSLIQISTLHSFIWLLYPWATNYLMRHLLSLPFGQSTIVMVCFKRNRYIFPNTCPNLQMMYLNPFNQEGLLNQDNYVWLW